MKRLLISSLVVLLVLSCCLTAGAMPFNLATVEAYTNDDGTVDYTSQNAAALAALNRKVDPLVLMYHKLSENPAEWSEWCTSPQNFEADIIYLKERGYTFVTSTELISRDNNYGNKVAVITFDDGYMSDYQYALPLLEKYNVKATFFVIGTLVGTNEYMDEEAIVKLSKSPLAEIGNHSDKLHLKTKQEIIQLHNGAEYINVVNDFLANKIYLENLIGKEVTSLSYPNGVYSRKVDIALKNNGVKITFSTGLEKFSYNAFIPTGRKNRAHNLTMSYYVK